MCITLKGRWICAMILYAHPRTYIALVELRRHPVYGKRVCRQVHKLADTTPRALSSNPAAETLRWRSPLWWRICQEVGGSEGSVAIVLGRPDRAVYREAWQRGETFVRQR